MKNTDVQKRWGILLAAFFVNLFLGGIYAWSEIKISLIKELNWSAGSTKLPFTIALVMFVVLTIIGGRLQDKYGPRYVGVIGGILFGMGFILSAFAANYFIMLLTFGVICGSAMGLCFSTTIPSVIKWFPLKQKGLVLGFAVSGLGLAPLYMDLLTNYLLKLYGIQNTFIILGVLSSIFLVIFAFLLTKPSPENLFSEEKQVDYNWKTMLGSKFFYAFWSLLLLFSVASLLIIGSLGSIADAQASWKAGFTLVIILAISNFIGRVLSGYFYNKFGFSKVILTIIFIQIANILFYWSYTTVPLLALGIAITGFSYGALFTLFPSLMIDSFGLKNFGLNFGLVYTAWGIASIFVPMFRSNFIVATGTLNIPHLIAIFLFVICINILMKLKSLQPLK